ncbi:hypothetical protein OCK74_03030 [Chitinophagaceae bacterium LB-8]|uniref:Uncharacterized protein n=1 Tax=Paraflavisolibacter caeni TaxID=2982496 RepID=A0A9X2XMY6_9BACT|nr:hypothetical protein [Paraflavisolibacter caeni]MCU7548068.1 hypothetical protein [Paraflavisolibacter caeni]
MKGFCFVMAGLILASCTDDDVVKINRNEPGIYAHYDIRAEEGSEMATCVVRLFGNQTMKNALTLEEPSKIELDGHAMKLDSSRYLGPYYELQNPVSEFEGQHALTFTSTDNKKHKEDFEFHSMSLLTDFSGPVSKAGDLVLLLEGLLPEDVVRVVVMDTAFKSNGINQLEAVKNGKLIIKKSSLQTLKSGPVVLEISRESESELRSGIQGTLSITYSLRRDLVLKD